LLELPALELPVLELEDGWPAEALVVVWPWNERAAATEIRPDSATAPAIIHRFMRAIRFNPASREVMALGLIVMARMIRPRCKSALNSR
jgi:hypothetical protein